MQIEDYKIDIEMYLKQIISLCDLMIETDNTDKTNILTIRDLSELAIDKGNE